MNKFLNISARPPRSFVAGFKHRCVAPICLSDKWNLRREGSPLSIDQQIAELYRIIHGKYWTFGVIPDQQIDIGPREELLSD